MLKKDYILAFILVVTLNPLWSKEFTTLISSLGGQLDVPVNNVVRWTTVEGIIGFLIVIAVFWFKLSLIPQDGIDNSWVGPYHPRIIGLRQLPFLNKKFLETDYPRKQAIGVFRRFHFGLGAKNRPARAGLHLPHPAPTIRGRKGNSDLVHSSRYARRMQEGR